MHPLFKLSLIVIIGIPVLAICVLEFFKWFSRRQKKWSNEFERKYSETDGAIVAHEDFDKVCAKITELRNLRWKEPERISVLVSQFGCKYEAEINGRSITKLRNHVEPVKRKLKTVKV